MYSPQSKYGILAKTERQSLVIASLFWRLTSCASFHPRCCPTLAAADNTPKIRHFDFYTDEFHHYPVDIAQNCLDVIDENIALDADNVFAKIGDVQKTAILLFAEYIDAATTIAAQSGGGGGGATSGWGRDKDEDELSWAHRCAMMANRLCRPRKKQGYGR